MVDAQPKSKAASVVQMRDFTSRFSPEERKSVATTLNDRGCMEIVHIVTNEGNADVFIFTVQHGGPMHVIGKGKGEFFLALLRSGEVLEASKGLTEFLEHLPGPNHETPEDQ
jgi:hypothetical protein